MRNAGLGAGLTLGLLLRLATPSTLTDDTLRVQHANKVLQEVMQVPGKGIRQEILAKADCIVIVPGEKTFISVTGGTFGKGVASCRRSDSWSAPLFVQVGGTSWGVQIGGESSDAILVVKDRDRLERLLSDKAKVGRDMTTAPGPVEGQTGAAVDAGLRAEIVGYSRSRGRFAGISLFGNTVQPDDSGNKAMYGDHEWSNILGGNVPAPAAAQPLLHTLVRYAGSGPGL